MAELKFHLCLCIIVLLSICLLMVFCCRVRWSWWGHSVNDALVIQVKLQGSQPIRCTFAQIVVSEEDLGAGVGEAVYLVMKRTPFRHSCSRELEFKSLPSSGEWSRAPVITGAVGPEAVLRESVSLVHLLNTQCGLGHRAECQLWVEGRHRGVGKEPSLNSTFALGD